MNQKLTVSPSPHFHCGDSTQGIMFDVLIALLPAAAASVLLFGYRSLIVMAVSVVSCVLFEYLARRVMKRDNTIGDLSAVVTGVLLAFNLPVTIDWWMVVIGAFTAIVVVKQFFGGIGQNFVNPALVGRVVLMISFPEQMSRWTAPVSSFGADAVTSASPLAALSAGSTEGLSIIDLFLGRRSGSLGETCALALLVGGLYLILRRVIAPTIPVVYLGSFALLIWLCGGNPLYHLLSGGVLLGAIFMATDYTTSPINFKGKVLYAVGCGVITVLIRLYGNLPEGVSIAIILMNILVPHIERLTTPKPFGWQKPQKAKAEKGAAQ